MSEIEIVQIPAERVKVLIGKDGSVKKLIETKCKVKLEIDSEGEVQIKGESSYVFFAVDVVKAIGRGFNPNIAIRLTNEEYAFYIINLKELANTDRAVARLKGRVIGEKGSIRSQIESSTDSSISVYGSTIGIISKIDSIEYAKEAVGMLLDGAKHSTVLSYLAKVKREMMQERLKGE